MIPDHPKTSKIIRYFPIIPIFYIILHFPHRPELFQAFLAYQCFHVIPHHSTIPHIDPACSGLAPAVLGCSRVSTYPKHSRTFLDFPVLFLPASVYPCCPKEPTLFRVVPVVPGPSAMPNYPRLSQAFPDCFRCSRCSRLFPVAPG